MRGSRAGSSWSGSWPGGRRPFSWCELQDTGFSLERAINHGLLLPHYLSDDPDEELASYVDRYLTEEIAAEGLARNLPGFARFLQTAATTNAQLLNYSNVARDAQVPRQTVVQWYKVLTDTLIATELPPLTGTVKRKAIETKAARRVHEEHLRGLRALAEEGLVERSIVVCREERSRIEPGPSHDIEIWPLVHFLTALWQDSLDPDHGTGRS